MTPLLVLGSGSWGTALAIKASAGEREVRLWGRDARALQRMRIERRNEAYLPGIELPGGISVEDDLDRACCGVTDVLVVTPSAAFPAMLDAIRARVATPRVAWGCKGFERERGRLLHQVVAGKLGDDTPCAVVSGPTFAIEVARNLPGAVVVAGNDAAFVSDLAETLHQPTFRVYRSDDLVGVQAGGAVKNVLAIAAGVSDGLELGANARAALISRGVAELVRLTQALGGRPETAMGLAGLGDLVLTCTDDQSRNRRFGLALGSGQDVQAAQAGAGKVVEGALACRDLMGLIRELSIELPIAEQVYNVVWRSVPAGVAVAELLARAPTTE